MSSTKTIHTGLSPRRIGALSAVVCLLILGRIANLWVQAPVLTGQDIYYSYVEGQRLRDGENPYARILEGDMLNNQKYATYFPVFYELSYLSQALGLDSFDSWVAFWRIVFDIFELGIAIFLYLALTRRHLEWLGVFAVAFWLFNRWTLAVVEMADLDFVPIFFLLLSLGLFPQKRWLSLLLFSVSLGVKQIAIFLVPLYLIWLWRSSGSQRLKNTMLGAAVLGSVPLMSSLPFLVWNANGFLRSILFSVTRYGADGGFPAYSLDAYLGGAETLERLLMLGLLCLLYAFAWKHIRLKYTVALLVMLTFISFNPVLYVQYVLWVIPLALLVACDFNQDGGLWGRGAGLPAASPDLSSS